MAASSSSSSVSQTLDLVKPPIKKRKNVNRVLFWAPECKYSVIFDRVKDMDWKLLDDEKMENKVNLFWIDVATIHDRFRMIQPWQTINHFPGMPNIARKNRMGQNLNKMQKLFPKEYSFYPRTWMLPSEMSDFRNQFDGAGNALNGKVFIIKPDAGCQGRGIFLTRTIDNVPTNESMVAQIYIKKPMLLDGFKFDLRLYCFVTSVKPLRCYLFHDGLVRMCTEEYVKPTKQNIHQVCMHLTNYAVNKHNENYVQSSATSSEEMENQEEGHKRSLLWFMNKIRNEHGESKADWLWRRMGTLCTRTILSILPTLSREYEQHFKSFKEVPIDYKKLSTPIIGGSPSGSATGTPTNGQRAKSSGATCSSGPHSREGKKRNGGAAATSSSSNGNGNNSGGDEDTGADTGDEGEDYGNEDEDDDDATSETAGIAAGVQGASSSSSTNIDKEKEGRETVDEDEDDATKPKKAKVRGSRCFEVLGFDIMLDSTLKPWLIEVNHLPSFGTDSPLDQDIKERLMRQVFSVLPVQADDQQAYMAYHRAESEKRLVAQKTAVRLEKEAQEAARNKPPVRPYRPPQPKKVAPPTPTEEETAAAAAAELAAKEAAEAAAAALAAQNGERVDEQPKEACSPERLEVIKKHLRDIYEEHSPEKISKIDRLMAKYMDHEEEFFQFVVAKYSVVLPDEIVFPNREKEQIVAAAAAAAAAAAEQQQQQEEEEEEEGKKKKALDDQALPSEKNGGALNASAPATKREAMKRYSRSVSPPRNSGRIVSDNIPRGGRTNVAAWKVSDKDEEAQFRADVLAMHVSNEFSDEWMRNELKKLTQFTQIFPVPPINRIQAPTEPDGTVDNSERTAIDNAASSVAETEHGAKDGDDEDEEDDEDEDGAGGEKVGGDGTAKPGSAEVSKRVASASPEDILVQAFIFDRKQTMRLHGHLPSQVPRSKVGEESTGGQLFPPLDGTRNNSSSSSASSSMGSGKGVVGWKAPPKPKAKEPVKLPTQNQTEAANRLSMGQSATGATSRRTSFGQNINATLAAQNNPLHQYGIVLDPHEYGSGAASGMMLPPGFNDNNSFAGLDLNMNVNMNTQGLSAYKIGRLQEENRQNRMRLEAQRASNAAVLRQQVFHFDPKYANEFGGGGGDLLQPTAADMLSVGGDNASVGGGGSVYSMKGAGEGGGLGLGMGLGNGGLMAVGGGGLSGKHGGGGGGGRGGSQKLAAGQSQQQQQQQQQRIRQQMLMLQQQQLQHHQGSAGVSGASDHSQEELLRQLFPSWF